MSESAYGYGGGESAGGGFFGGCGMTNWSSTRSARPNPDPVGTKHQRVIRSQSPIQEEKKEEKICDIGALRKKVMEDLCEELYEEVYSEIKGDVKAELLKQKPEIVKEIAGELRERLKSELRKSLIQGEGGGR